MTDMMNELWLRERMLDHRGPDVFDGITDSELRKQRLREAVKECGLELVIIGAKDKKPVNWAQAFETLYGEPL